jgi:hypothetical protein
MFKSAYKKVPLFTYLGILQLFTALLAGIIGLLFAKYAEGSLLQFLISFFPDVSLLTWSIVGLIMLVFQVSANIVGLAFSFVRSESASGIAMFIGGVEALWMGYQFFILHMHNILVPLFFVLSFAQLILGYLLSERIKEIHKTHRDNQY